MTISAKVICDSTSSCGVSLTTLQLRYPKFIHGEFMTHRVFSRNASSSRAIPTWKLLEDVRDNPFVPIHWGKNQKGMQAEQELSPEEQKEAREMWLAAAYSAWRRARAMADLGVHKQIVNRIIEPFSHINVVVTSTEWQNFFDLRIHPDAQPEMRELAAKIHDSRLDSDSAQLRDEQWHLPYVTPEEKLALSLPDQLSISVARCARISYNVFGETTLSSLEADIELCNKLRKSVPFHASPFEHQAKPDAFALADANTLAWLNPELHGNFFGWQQYRKLIEANVQLT